MKRDLIEERYNITRRIGGEEENEAQALEHEINHVNGIVYIDQVRNPDRFLSLPDLEAEEE